jgi:hypothetical protein
MPATYTRPTNKPHWIRQGDQWCVWVPGTTAPAKVSVVRKDGATSEETITGTRGVLDGGLICTVAKRGATKGRITKANIRYWRSVEAAAAADVGGRCRGPGCHGIARESGYCATCEHDELY